MQTRTNEEWLSDLRGENQNQAIEDLGRILKRGLIYALSTRIRTDLDTQVDDFVQDAILRILDKMDTFRGESQFTTWAQKVAVRVAFTELRRQRWKDVSIEDLLPEDSGDFTPLVLSDPSPDPEKRTTQTLMLEMIDQMMKTDLTERQRTALLAVLHGGMPLEEVARRMDTNRNALYKLLHDARKQMRDRLLEKGLSPQEILAVFESG
ncbi:MAG: sigma-70 family RNA polymerase sigma factor [Anaerolineales bacterium]|nr:MAG: sigma-70 family RNA polymerase sigma factor [Anaerolineales bacterium]